jgi:hypothetical protein
MHIPREIACLDRRQRPVIEINSESLAVILMAIEYPVSVLIEVGGASRVTPNTRRANIVFDRYYWERFLDCRSELYNDIGNNSLHLEDQD